MSPHVVWWLKRDLRLADNAALSEACQMARAERLPVVALYLREPESQTAEEYHPRRDRFVHECLADLAPRLARLGIHLICGHGRAVTLFSMLKSKGLVAVFSHEETGVLWTFQRDMVLKSFFAEQGIPWREFPTNGVVRGLRDRDLWHGIYRKRMAAPIVETPIEPLEHAWDTSCLGPTGENDNTFFVFDDVRSGGRLGEAAWSWTNPQQIGGEGAASAVLEHFLRPEIHKNYLSSVSRPGDSQVFCSRLSPYLAFGCLSSRQILSRLSSHRQMTRGHGRSLAAFRSRLAWRCHFVQKLENFPRMQELEQNAALQGMRSEMSAEEIQRWQTGATGYPLVDACLRSVHTTGYLNFRMRAMLMSFATHLLWRDWRIPAWDLARAFLDFEPGIHFAQVQMQASVTGNNQIRIYNPLKQSLDNDPDAVFIKEWVPELRHLPAAAIHNLESLPDSYAKPIAQLKESVAHARRTLFARFKENDVRHEAKLVQARLGSRGGTSSRSRKQKTTRGRATKKGNPV